MRARTSLVAMFGVLAFGGVAVLAGLSPMIDRSSSDDAADTGSSGSVDAAGARATWAASDVEVDAGAAARGHPSSEYSIAIDPTDTSRMIAVGIEHGHGPDFVCCSRGTWQNALYASQDGGASWTRTGIAVPVGYDGEPMTCDDSTTWDPWITFDRNGRAYVSYMSSGAGIPGLADPCSDATFAVATSTDGGLTWGEPVVVMADPACFPDRDAMAADPNSDSVYVAWSAFCETEGPIMVSRTTDGGATWSDPVSATGADFSPYGASIAVASDGSVHVAYYREAAFDGCVNIVASVGTSVYSGETVVATSRDGGVTWTHEIVGPVCDLEYQSLGQPLNGGSDFSWPMLSADVESQRLAVVWANRDGLDAKMSLVSTSADGGQTWSTPELLADAGRGTFMPTVAVAGGMIRLAWLSMNAIGEFDARYMESSDGATWSEPFILATQGSCNCWGPLTSTYVHGQGLGHYIDMDAQAGKLVVVWPDARDPMGVQSPYVRVGSYNP